MDVAQVKKAVDTARSLGKFNSIEVLSTTGYRYRNNESSILYFDDGKRLVCVIRTNNDPARVTMNQEGLEINFLMYEDISAINFLADPNTVKEKNSEIGTFDAEELKPILKMVSSENYAGGFSDPNKKYVSTKDATEENPATVADPSKKQSWEVDNVPMIL